jgi:CRP/FNR family transcriptional regulator
MKNIERILTNKSAATQKFSAGKSIFDEGDEFKGVYYILDGMVKILRNSNKKKIAVWFADKGDLIGVSSFFSDSHFYTYSAIVHDSDCRVLFVPENKFKELLIEYPELKEELIKTICARIAYTEERIIKFKKESLRKRFLDTLLFFGKKEQEKNTAIRIKYSLLDLTEIMGSTKQNIKRLLDEFERQRLLKFDSHTIVIRDLSRLEQLATA